MKIKVLYHSSTGNTEKVANAIASALNVTAEPIDVSTAPMSEPVDLLFIGDGVYFNKPSKITEAYVGRLTPALVKNVSVFATYGGSNSIGESIKALLQKQGLHVVGEPYICKGKAWGVLNRSHPNEAELSAARHYAEGIVSEIPTR